MILRNNKTIITHDIKNNNIKYSKNAIYVTCFKPVHSSLPRIAYTDKK